MSTAFLSRLQRMFVSQPERHEPFGLVLIAGPPRSGTTWLNRELCNLPGYAPFLPECSFLTQQIALYGQSKHYGEPRRFAAYLGSKDNLATLYRGIVGQMIDLTLQINSVGKSDRVILKDPELSHHVGDLEDILPAHRLVCIVRDPRDVIASVKKVAARKQQPWDIEQAITWIYPYYGSLMSHQRRKPKHTIFVRYEDLVIGGLGPIRTFLGHETVQGDQEAHDASALHTHIDRSDPFFSDLYLKPTTSETIGSFTTLLDEAEIRRIEQVYSGVLSRWGYAPWSPVGG